MTTLKRLPYETCHMPHAATVSHQLCHGNNSDDRRRVLLEGSAKASKDASKTLEALLKPSIATVTADLAAGVVVVVVSFLSWW